MTCRPAAALSGVSRLADVICRSSLFSRGIHRDAHRALREHLLKVIKRRSNVASQARPEIILLSRGQSPMVVGGNKTMIPRAEFSFRRERGVRASKEVLEA